MKLSAPSSIIFLISTCMVVLIVGANYFGFDVPVVTALARLHPFEITLVAWFLLFMGVAFNL